MIRCKRFIALAKCIKKNGAVLGCIETSKKAFKPRIEMESTFINEICIKFCTRNLIANYFETCRLFNFSVNTETVNASRKQWIDYCNVQLSGTVKISIILNNHKKTHGYFCIVEHLLPPVRSPGIFCQLASVFF